MTRVQTEGLDYLRVTETDGAYVQQYPVGVAEGYLTPESLARFLSEVHRPYRSADSGVISCTPQGFARLKTSSTMPDARGCGS